MNAHHILQAMRAGEGQELPLRDEPARAEVYGEFARIEEAERQAAASVTMLDLVNRTQQRPALAAPAVAELSSSSSSKLDELPRTRTKDEAGRPSGAIEEIPAAARFPDIEPPPAPPGPPVQTAEKRPVVVPDENPEFPL
jgi:hypothetical protein